MRTRAMRRQASGMPSSLPPQLVMTWLPIRDVASALRVSKDWCGASEPLFQAIAGRHGLRLALGSWRATVQRYRSYVGNFDFDSPTVFPHGQHPLRLHGAAQRDDVPAIQRFISEGVDVNYGSSVGQTPLHIAAMWGNMNALNALIAAGCDINRHNRIVETDRCGGTPLHVAANSRKAPLWDRYCCAARLIAAGANARILNGEENAPYQSQFPDHEPGSDVSDDEEESPMERIIRQARVEQTRQTFRECLQTEFYLPPDFARQLAMARQSSSSTQAT